MKRKKKLTFGDEACINLLSSRCLSVGNTATKSKKKLMSNAHQTAVDCFRKSQDRAAGFRSDENVLFFLFWSDKGICCPKMLKLATYGRKRLTG